jgi:hypothetical protein
MLTKKGEKRERGREGGTEGRGATNFKVFQSIQTCVIMQL